MNSRSLLSCTHTHIYIYILLISYVYRNILHRIRTLTRDQKQTYCSIILYTTTIVSVEIMRVQHTVFESPRESNERKKPENLFYRNIVSQYKITIVTRDYP